MAGDPSFWQVCEQLQYQRERNRAQKFWDLKFLFMCLKGGAASELIALVAWLVDTSSDWLIQAAQYLIMVE